MWCLTVLPSMHTEIQVNVFPPVLISRHIRLHSGYALRNSVEAHVPTVQQNTSQDRVIRCTLINGLATRHPMNVHRGNYVEQIIILQWRIFFFYIYSARSTRPRDLFVQNKSALPALAARKRPIILTNGYSERGSKGHQFPNVANVKFH